MKIRYVERQEKKNIKPTSTHIKIILFSILASLILNLAILIISDFKLSAKFYNYCFFINFILVYTILINIAVRLFQKRLFKVHYASLDNLRNIHLEINIDRSNNYLFNKSNLEVEKIIHNAIKYNLEEV